MKEAKNVKLSWEDYVCYRTLNEAIPISEAGENQICSCLNTLSKRFGFKLLTLEKMAYLDRLSRWERRARRFMERRQRK